MKKVFSKPDLKRIALARKHGFFEKSPAEKRKYVRGLKSHIRQVRLVAFSIAERLKVRGEKINPKDISRAGWMHDIARNATGAEQFGAHEPAGAVMAKRFGFESAAKLIATHGLIPSKTAWKKMSLAQKLLVYADARVAPKAKEKKSGQDFEIVPLKERTAFVLSRYKQGEPLFAPHVLHYQLLEEFEKELRNKYKVIVP